MTLKSLFTDNIPQTPLGEIFFSVKNNKLALLQFNTSLENYLAFTQEYFGEVAEYHPESGNTFSQVILEYFGANKPISGIDIDISSLTTFQQDVLIACQKIPYGATSNYKSIGKAIGKEHGAQAVGQALRFNPIPIIIPCHRVIGADGSLSGYGGVMGSEDKIALLKHEGSFLM